MIKSALVLVGASHPHGGPLATKHVYHVRYASMYVEIEILSPTYSSRLLDDGAGEVVRLGGPSSAKLAPSRARVMHAKPQTPNPRAAAGGRPA